jgi:hypothetical protein
MQVPANLLPSPHCHPNYRLTASVLSCWPTCTCTAQVTSHHLLLHACVLAHACDGRLGIQISILAWQRRAVPET